MDYGHISIRLYQQDIKIFQKITASICGQSDYYYSDSIDYIQGDVSKNLHLTIFYGLTDNQKNRNKINDLIKKSNLTSMDLGKIFLMPGYKDLYQVLCVEVLDQDHKLLNYSNSFKNFNYDSSIQHPNFTPHLTLAYVKPNYQLKNIPLYPNILKIKEIKYYEK